MEYFQKIFWKYSIKDACPEWRSKYRAYDSNIGRWLSRDPIAEKGGLNLYEYVGNNVISFIDDLGKAKKEISHS